MEELMQECSSYTWKQVLLEIDRKDGDYAVRFSSRRIIVLHQPVRYSHQW